MAAAAAAVGLRRQGRDGAGNVHLRRLAHRQREQQQSRLLRQGQLLPLRHRLRRRTHRKVLQRLHRCRRNRYHRCPLPHLIPELGGGSAASARTLTVTPVASGGFKLFIVRSSGGGVHVSSQ